MASLCVCGYPGSPTSNPCSRRDGTDVKGRAMLLGVIVPECPPSLPRTGNHRRLCPCRGIKLERFNVTGFVPTSAYPHACSWTFATGSAVDVHPVECEPP